MCFKEEHFLQWTIDVIQLAGVVLLTAILHIWNWSAWHPLFAWVMIFFPLCFYIGTLVEMFLIVWGFRSGLSQSAEVGWFWKWVTQLTFWTQLSVSLSLIGLVNVCAKQCSFSPTNASWYFWTVWFLTQGISFIERKTCYSLFVKWSDWVATACWLP